MPTRLGQACQVLAKQRQSDFAEDHQLQIILTSAHPSSVMSHPAESAESIAKAAKDAFEASQLIPVSERTRALSAIKHELELSKTEILEANRKDMEVCSLLSLNCDVTSFVSRQPKLRWMLDGCPVRCSIDLILPKGKNGIPCCKASQMSLLCLKPQERSHMPPN